MVMEGGLVPIPPWNVDDVNCGLDSGPEMELRLE